jgi:hypothetical protein
MSIGQRRLFLTRAIFFPKSLFGATTCHSFTAAALTARTNALIQMEAGIMAHGFRKFNALF